MNLRKAICKMLTAPASIQSFNGAAGMNLRKDDATDYLGPEKLTLQWGRRNEPAEGKN